MPTALQDIVDKRASAFAKSEEFRARSAKDEDLSAEDQAAWKRALDEVDSLGLIISNQERDAKLDAEFGKIDEQTRAAAAAGGAPAGSVDAQVRAHEEAFASYVRNGESGLTPEQRSVLNDRTAQARAQGTDTGSAGGYTVPEGFWAKVTETRKFYAQVAELADVITTGTGNPLPWPTNDDTANTGRLLSENTQVTETALTFGQKNLGAYTFSSDLILMSLQLAQDNGVDLPGRIAAIAGTRLGRIENSYFTTGTGSSQPQGYITGATTGKTTASATAITYDEIIDLVHSVDIAYRVNARFAMHDSVLAYVRKLRDDVGGAGLGRPLWEPSVQVGVPDTLLGYGLTVNNFQDSAVTATKKTMAFGDFKAALAVRRVNGGQLMTLRERYADYLQVGYFAFERADSVVQDASAVKLLVQHS